MALSTALLACVPVFGAELGADEVVLRLQAWLDGTRDLRCRFEQTLLSGAMGAEVVERGSLLLRRPGRMRWEYEEPEAKTALLEGDRTLVYLPGERQAIRGRLAAQGGGLLSLLAGTDRVEALFEPLLVATPDRGGAGAYLLRLVPRGQVEGFEEVTLTVRPPAFGVEAAEVLDPAGNRIVVRFAGARRNRGIPEKAFAFEIPAGTEVADVP